jgi:AcrR family transcriptional regulator
MPAIAKTSDDAVVRAARKLVDRGGPNALSMQAVGDAVGVRAPSLYKRFPDREALVAAVATAAALELGASIAKADRTARTPRAALTAIAIAYRAFAHRAPHAYGLLFAPGPGPSIASRVAAVAPVLARLTALVGEASSLPAARLLTAWLHGFISMELSGAFQLGGDVDAAFDYGLATLLDAVARRRRASSVREQ